MKTPAEIAITGMGVVSPVGIGLAAFEDGLFAGRSAGRAYTGYDTDGWRSRIACPVPDFDPSRWLAPRAARRMDRTGHFGVAAATMAFEDAGLALEDVDRSRVAVITGTCAPMEWIWAAHETCFTRGPRLVSPTTVLATFPDAAAARIAEALGLHGPCHTLSTACASGADALGYAMLMLRADLVDVVVAGGVEAPIVPAALIAFGQARALSERNDAPEAASRPFAVDRDGFVMGEGAGLVVLERAADARARGARLRGLLGGHAATSDAWHMTNPEPSGEQRLRAIRLALAQAGVSADDLDFVSAHGTGTPPNDVSEAQVLRKLFGHRADGVPVTAPKSMLGHGLGAACGLSVCATLICLARQSVHPSINCETQDPACDLDLVRGSPRPVRARTALVNAFGFGGKNAALVLRAAP